MGLIINVLGSGSSGNSILISSGKTTLFIDAGFSAKNVKQRIEKLPFNLTNVNALILSHEHSDHSSGWQSWAKLFDVPVYMTPSTQNILQATKKNKTRVNPFLVGSSFTIEDFKIHAFTIPHDAADPAAFIIQHKHHQIAIATDLGYMPVSVKKYVSESDIIILESNHDIEMLKNGPYPWHLKQRIMSRQGHLSNDTVGAFIKECINEKCLFFFLVHISRKNNTPELALTTSLANLNKKYPAKMILTYQDTISETIEV